MPDPQEGWIESVYIDLGRLISEQRTERRMTQEALAAQVGLTRSSITNLEAGRQKIQIHLLLRIARALDVAPEDLLPQPDNSHSGGFLERLDEHLEGESNSTRTFVLEALQNIPGK